MCRYGSSRDVPSPHYSVSWATTGDTGKLPGKREESGSPRCASRANEPDPFFLARSLEVGERGADTGHSALSNRPAKTRPRRARVVNAEGAA